MRGVDPGRGRSDPSLALFDVARFSEPVIPRRPGGGVRSPASPALKGRHTTARGNALVVLYKSQAPFEAEDDATMRARRALRPPHRVAAVAPQPGRRSRERSAGRR